MDIKSELIHYSKLLQEKSLVIGPGGNTSCRITDKIAIKPSGLDFKDLEIADLVEVEIDENSNGRILCTMYSAISRIGKREH